MELIFLPLMFLLMWLLFIRPQQQRVRKHQEVIASIEVGDDIVTAGGMLGTVTGIDADHLRVEVAPGVELRLLRGAITRRLDAEPSSSAPTIDPTGDEDR